MHPSPTHPANPRPHNGVPHEGGHPAPPADSPQHRSNHPANEYGSFVGQDGYRHFSTDAAGEQYGERVLGHVLEGLPPELRNAVHAYTVQSLPNGFLRAGDPLGSVGHYFQHLENESHGVHALAPLNSGRMPGSRAELENMLRNPHATDVQRAWIQHTLAAPDVFTRVNEMWGNYQRHNQLHGYFGEPPTVDAFRRRIAAIDAALNRPLPEPVSAIRGMHDISFLTAGDGRPLGSRDPRELIGVSQTERGYMSTSLGANPTVVDGRPFEYRMRLDLPEGTHGLWMGQRSAYPDQRELILPRETEYRIVNVTQIGTANGRPVFEIHAEVVPHSSPPRPDGHPAEPARPETPRSQSRPSDVTPAGRHEMPTPRDINPSPENARAARQSESPAPNRAVADSSTPSPTSHPHHEASAPSRSEQPRRSNPSTAHTATARAAEDVAPGRTIGMHADAGAPVSRAGERFAPSHSAEGSPPSARPAPHSSDRGSTEPTAPSAHSDRPLPDSRSHSPERHSREDGTSTAGAAQPRGEMPPRHGGETAARGDHDTRHPEDIRRSERMRSDPARRDEQRDQSRSDRSETRLHDDNAPHRHNEPTADQRRALHAYTDPDAGLYTDLNNRLRDNSELDPTQHQLAQDISAGLGNLPAHAGTVWRGTSLSPEELARYIPGETVTEAAFTSTSRDPRRIFTGNVEFVIHSSTGRDISGLSARPGEREVLFDRNTTFEVRGVVHDPSAGLFGRTRIYLYESPPQHSEHPSEHFGTHENPGAEHTAGSSEHSAEPAPTILHGSDRTAIGDDPQTRRVYENLRTEGEHDVIVHGNRFGRPTPGNEGETDPHHVAEAIRNNPDYRPGTPVRLVACHAGNDIGWAQRLADELGVPVRAPSDTVGVRRAPDSPAVVHDGGHWVTFHPSETHSSANEPTHHAPDPNAPHTTDGHRDGWDIMADSEPDPPNHPRLPHDHSTAPLSNEPKEIAHLGDHPGGVERDEHGLISAVDGRPVEQYTDATARDRANQFRAAAQDNRPRPGESQQQATKRVLRSQREGTYVSPSTHGSVNAVVVDRRTGSVYEGTNGDGSSLIPQNRLHPALAENLRKMQELGRQQPGGGYPELDRNGYPETLRRDYPGYPQGTRPHPHFDNPLGHAEVKAANEALWARERENEIRRATGRIELPTGADALAELYSQTYRPFRPDAPQPVPYCANCHHMMGAAQNYAGRHEGFPPSADNLVDAYREQDDTK
ncbi:ADP-ribosyltransferase [Nocardia aobensis]|uniref:ADP-ribosyltransferase n=1 Tax=Nocardia aobensis TaxID=257277 RepID=A0ABW6PCR9_9NOCA